MRSLTCAMAAAATLTAAALLALPSAASAAGGPARAPHAPTETALRDECSLEGSQADMRACLQRKNRESEKDLKLAQAAVLRAVAGWDEDARYTQLTKDRLAAASRSFVHYRAAECAFMKSIGGGAIGAALDLRHLACTAALNWQRTRSLHSSAQDLAQRAR
ncbi:lysozyme inhibitor LprI family protein [Paracidovorax valerianellae]|nr:lysozyme inhibitor LprI family protein [Paracidovorax valerianellae]